MPQTIEDLSPMKRQFHVVTSFSFLLLAFIGIVALMNCSSVHSSEPLMKEKNSNASHSEDYWTPERLKEAQPLELPHPIPPDIHSPVLPDESTPSAIPSDEASGHEGEGEIPPDGSNILFEDGETPPTSLPPSLAED